MSGLGRERGERYGLKIGCGRMEAGKGEEGGVEKTPFLSPVTGRMAGPFLEAGNVQE